MDNTDNFLEAVFEEFSPDNQILAMGVLCNDSGTYRVEGFWKIESEKDIPPMKQLSLRARFNAHREMKMFYFKTNDFESLHAKFISENENFANWVFNTKSIKMEDL